MELPFDKILITGASGSLGRQLVHDFTRLGVQPIAQVRATSNITYLEQHKLELRQADFGQDADLSRLVDGVDAIIHTAAWVNFRRDRLTQFTQINALAATNLFRSAQKAGVKRFVHVSTVAAVGAMERRLLIDKQVVGDAFIADEDTPFNLGGLRIPYIMTKHAAELELLELADEGRTELVIVNPSIIVAPSRSGDDRSKARRRLGRWILPDLANRVNLVDIRDVSSGIVAALAKGRHRQRYILGGDNISGRDLFLAISSHLDKTPHLVGIPRPLLNLAARAAVFLSKLRGRAKVSFYPDIVRMLDYDWAYSSLKARRELGYRSRSVHASLQDLLTNSFSGTYMKPSQP
ncbi:MAG: NAD-dependent epimerase/dehydratase family protein [bacterium]